MWKVLRQNTLSSLCFICFPPCMKFAWKQYIFKHFERCNFHHQAGILTALLWRALNGSDFGSAQFKVSKLGCSYCGLPLSMERKRDVSKKQLRTFRSDTPVSFGHSSRNEATVNKLQLPHMHPSDLVGMWSPCELHNYHCFGQPGED